MQMRRRAPPQLNQPNAETGQIRLAGVAGCGTANRLLINDPSESQSPGGGVHSALVGGRTPLYCGVITAFVVFFSAK